MKSKIIFALSLFALSACDSNQSNSASQNPDNRSERSSSRQNRQQSNSDREEWVQIERLARPAINEGLILTHAFNAAFNSISPDLDLSDAAAPVRDEAVAVLSLLNALSSNLGITTAPSPEVVAGGFLPDVMRIDTSIDMAPQTTAYNADFVLVDGQYPMLTGGRKIEDDVMDITLSYLLAGDPTGASIGDGVTYGGAAGVNCSRNDSLANQPGHSCLFGQTERKKAAVFPFLADPI